MSIEDSHRGKQPGTESCDLTFYKRSRFREAGFAKAKVASHRGTEVIQSVEDLVVANIDGWFPFAGIRLDAKTLEALIDETEAALKSYVLPAGSVEYGVGVHIVSATKE